MDSSFYLWIVTLIIFAICAIVIIVMDKCTNIYYRNKEKRFNETHQEYIQFLEQFNTMRDELWEIDRIMPKYRKTVDECLTEMKYYPEFSEWYKYYKNKLDVSQRLLESYKEDYEKKNCEIYDFVRANKTAIETIKDEDGGTSYKDWVRMYKLDDV